MQQLPISEALRLLAADLHLLQDVKLKANAQHLLFAAIPQECPVHSVPSRCRFRIAGCKFRCFEGKQTFVTS